MSHSPCSGMSTICGIMALVYHFCNSSHISLEKLNPSCVSFLVTVVSTASFSAPLVPPAAVTTTPRQHCAVWEAVGDKTSVVNFTATFQIRLVVSNASTKKKCTCCDAFICFCKNVQLILPYVCTANSLSLPMYLTFHWCISEWCHEHPYFNAENVLSCWYLLSNHTASFEEVLA